MIQLYIIKVPSASYQKENNRRNSSPKENPFKLLQKARRHIRIYQYLDEELNIHFIFFRPNSAWYVNRRNDKGAYKFESSKEHVCARLLNKRKKEKEQSKEERLKWSTSLLIFFSEYHVFSESAILKSYF